MEVGEIIDENKISGIKKGDKKEFILSEKLSITDFSFEVRNRLVIFFQDISRY